MQASSETNDSTGRAPSGSDEGKYVYCIIRSADKRDFGSIGIGGKARLHGPLQGSGGGGQRHLDTDLRSHPGKRARARVRERAVVRDHTVIPMSFGTIFRTGDDIVELLKSTYRALEDVLQKMKDKIELGLKVLWNQGRVIRHLEEEDDEIRRLKQEIENSGQNSTYFARMQLGRLVEGALEAAANQYVLDIHESLKPVAVASRTNKSIGDRMILNGAYLVDRSCEEDFDRVVKQLPTRSA